MISCTLQQIDELANIGRQGEKGELGEIPLNLSLIKGINRTFKLKAGNEDWRNQHILIHLPLEMLTRLKDAIFADNWEIQVFQVVVELVGPR